jgi:Zn-dependent protease
MDSQQLAGGLLLYMMLVVLLTLHELGHAWTALKCGDDTAYLQGRVSLNPLVHIDPIGTVLLPLLAIFGPAGIGRFFIGWAKPVPVNPYNLRRPRLDDILVTLAGPGMNLIVAVLLVALARVFILFHFWDLTPMLLKMADLSLLLCFFNLLIPIPPLDGSQIMRVLTGMSMETYAQLARWGFIIVIALLWIPDVRIFLTFVTEGTLALIVFCFGFPPLISAN